MPSYRVQRNIHSLVEFLSNQAKNLLFLSEMMSNYSVYIMSSRSRTIYIGITNDLKRRVYEYKNHLVEGFTKKYKTIRLIYFEETTDVRSAIGREKQIKGWVRKRKVELIESVNPTWRDLSEDWY